MDFPLANPARYRAVGTQTWEDEAGMNVFRDTRIAAMFY
jgi:hypothetical protein